MPLRVLLGGLADVHRAVTDLPFFLKSDCSLQQALNHCACKSAETYTLPFCGTVWFLLHVAGPAQGIVTDVQAVVWR